VKLKPDVGTALPTSLSQLAFEVLVFVLVWSNVFMRPRESNSGLSKAIYHEGTIYFLVLFGAPLAMYWPSNSLSKVALRLLNVILGIVAPVSIIIGYHETSLTNSCRYRLYSWAYCS
jgi:hypothetical protein